MPSIYPIDFPPPKWTYSFWEFISSSAPYSLSLVGCLSLKIYQKNQYNEALANSLKMEKAKTEIQYLRAHINPHLLFNSLNNIHTLALKDPHKAADYTILLSDLLRYMLYEVKKQQTKLKNELKCLSDYFGIIGLRIDQPKQLNMLVQIVDGTAPIIPLLLLSLIENGVKHSGIEYNKNAHLTVNIKQLDGFLDLNMQNSIDRIKSPNNRQGIGFDNLRQRLILNYPNKHQFSFKIENEIAYTRLQLNLHP